MVLLRRSNACFYSTREVVPGAICSHIFYVCSSGNGWHVAQPPRHQPVRGGGGLVVRVHRVEQVVQRRKRVIRELRGRVRREVAHEPRQVDAWCPAILFLNLI